MLRYFIAGNFWLLLALVLYVGRTPARTDAKTHSLFGAGQVFLSHEYWAVIAISFAASLLYFAMYAASAKKN
jgi:hypothetical protein